MACSQQDGSGKERRVRRLQLQLGHHLNSDRQDRPLTEIILFTLIKVTSKELQIIKYRPDGMPGGVGVWRGVLLSDVTVKVLVLGV